MMLDAPFYRQNTPFNCGPVALRMVLAYLDKDPGIEILEQRAGIKEGKGVSTIQIAIAAASLGYRTEFFSKHILFNEENLKLDYYKIYSDMDLEQSKGLVQIAKKAGVRIEERLFSLEELLCHLTEDSIPTVLIDWNVVKERRGYQGHFVPLVGYDEKNVYVHNHGLEDTKPFFSIDKTKFDKARKAQGADEDIVIVYRK